MKSSRFDDYGDVLTLQDVAALLGWHLETVRTWVREGKLPARKIGRPYVVLKQDLLAWLQAHPRVDASTPDPRTR